MHAIDVSVLGKYLKKFLKGGSLRIHPNEHEHMLRLVFKSKSPLTRLIKNMNAGKATHLKHTDLHDVISHESGGSLFSTFKNIVTNPSNIKTVAKIVAPELGKVVGNKVGQITGSQALGDLTNKGINAVPDAIPGSGIFGEIGSFLGNMVDNKTGTGIKRRGRPKKVKKSEKSESGNGIFGSIGNFIGNMIDDKTGTGIKRRGRPRKGGSFSPLGGQIPSGVHNNVMMLRKGGTVTNSQQYLGINGTPSYSIPTMMHM